MVRAEKAVIVPLTINSLNLVCRRRRRGGLFEIETVRHVVRCCVAFIQGRQAESSLAKFQQTDVGMQHFRNVPALDVRSEHQATDA